MSIDAVVGIPGAGKSYWAVNEALSRWVAGYKKARERHHQLLKLSKAGLNPDELLNMPPVTSYQALAANFDMDRLSVARFLRFRHRIPWREAVVLAAGVQVVKSIQNLLDVWNAILIFDEAQLWFNARDFALFPTEVLSFWTQHRKGGIDVILVTQKYEMIDSNIRGLVANLYRARPIPWSLKFLRMIGNRVGLLSDGGRPMFRYTVYMEESEGKVKTSTKGLGEAISKNSTVVLDPLVASCYATTGQFYAPSQELHQAAGTSKGKVSGALGLKYDMSRFRKKLDGPQPLLPGLTLKDLAECYVQGVAPSELVAAVQKDYFDEVVPLSRFRAAAPLDGGAKRVEVTPVTILFEDLPKENPSAVTEGVRDVPAQYKGWSKRGVRNGT